MRLANKVSIITGAGAGMGYAAAHLFAPPSQFARREATPSSSAVMSAIPSASKR